MDDSIQSIGTTWAAILALLVIAYCWCAFILFGIKNRSGYPTVVTGLICLSAALWIMVSIVVDRSVNLAVYGWASRFTYLFPMVCLYAFSIFSMRYPPKTSPRTQGAIAFSLSLISIAGIALALSPNGVITDAPTRLLMSQPHQPHYFLVLSIFGCITLVSAAIIASKWRKVAPTDKKPIVLLVLGLTLSATGGIIFSLINGANPGSSYLYSFSYLCSIFFVSSLFYSMARHGALGISVTVKRSLLVVISIAAVVLGILLF